MRYLHINYMSLLKTYICIYIIVRNVSPTKVGSEELKGNYIYEPKQQCIKNKLTHYHPMLLLYQTRLQFLLLCITFSVIFLKQFVMHYFWHGVINKSFSRYFKVKTLHHFEIYLLPLGHQIDANINRLSQSTNMK